MIYNGIWTYVWVKPRLQLIFLLWNWGEMFMRPQNIAITLGFITRINDAVNLIWWFCYFFSYFSTMTKLMTMTIIYILFETFLLLLLLLLLCFTILFSDRAWSTYEKKEQNNLNIYHGHFLHSTYCQLIMLSPSVIFCLYNKFLHFLL